MIKIPDIPYVVRGTITDRNNNTINSANIKITDSVTGVTYSDTTNSIGQYLITISTYESKRIFFVEAWAVNPIRAYSGYIKINTTIGASVLDLQLKLLNEFENPMERFLKLRDPFRDIPVRVYDNLTEAYKVREAFNATNFTVTRDANNRIKSMVETDGHRTRNTTFTRDSNGLIESVNQELI